MILVVGGARDELSLSLFRELERLQTRVALIDPDGLLRPDGSYGPLTARDGAAIEAGEVDAVWIGRQSRFIGSSVDCLPWDVAGVPKLPGPVGVVRASFDIERQVRLAKSLGFEIADAADLEHNRRKVFVTVVGDSIFALEVESSVVHRDIRDWWKFDIESAPTFAACFLAPDDALHCRSLVRRLGLDYALIDLVENDRRLSFVSVDPYGQAPSHGDFSDLSVVRALAARMLQLAEGHRLQARPAQPTH